MTEWSPLFSEPHPSREFCVQYGETDYDFLCRMAAEEGIFFYEEHAQKSTDQSLVLCDTVRYLPESFEIPWNPNTRTEVSTLCISQFRYSAQIRPSSVVTKDYTFKRPGWAGRFDQEGQYRREAAGDLAGEITGVTDGAGREFRLVLTTQAQRAEEARTSSLSSSDSSRPLSASPFPDTLPGTEYGPDRGIRLSAVWLMHDP
ncbi:hypothetical protein PU12_08635, partial [Escherichia coli]